MTRSASCLFTALSLGNLSLSSRIVMAPMTRSFSPGGIPGDEVAAYYGRRAAQDLGLIITEGTAVDRDAARNDPNVPVFHGEEALAGWKKTVDAVHAQACAIWPQLWHVGALPNPTVSWRPGSPFESPSGQYKANRQHGKAMTEADVRDCIEAFAKAAADAGSDLNFAGWARKLTGKPVITVGSVGLTGEFIAAFRGEASQPASLDALIERFERGDFDLVAVGRALISDPAWASKVRRGQWDDLAAFDPASLALLH
ncbi:MAG: hypothetical protein EBX61_08330 [Betaproteobacteria bacterium]|nr:hypothetical protein [Betaproteobacteria bacterium]